MIKLNRKTRFIWALGAYVKLNKEFRWYLTFFKFKCFPISKFPNSSSLSHIGRVAHHCLQSPKVFSLI